MHSRGLAIVFLLLGASIGMLATAVPASWAAVLTWWLALSFVVVGVAYLGYARLVFAKNGATGRIPWHRKVLLLPYFAMTWGIWHAARLLSRENAYDSVDPNLYIGRRLLSHEYPVGVRTIIDLTWEFDAVLPRSEVTYRSFPLLDAAALPSDDLSSAARAFARLEKPIYLHCAQGHGRTAMVAAALLVALGRTGSSRTALERVCAVRRGARLNGAQTRAALASERSE